MTNLFRAVRRHAALALEQHATLTPNVLTDKTCVVAAKANGSPVTALSVSSTLYNLPTPYGGSCTAVLPHGLRGSTAGLMLRLVVGRKAWDST